MPTKDEIIETLEKKGIDHDPSDLKADLEALLPDDDKVEEVVVPEKKSDREARWDAFLERYKAQNPAKYKIKSDLGTLGQPPSYF